MDEFSSSLVILFCFGFFICFHFFDKWGLSGRQGFSPLNYPLLQSSPQVLFVFLFSCQSDQLRFKPLYDKLFESTPLVSFVFVVLCYLLNRLFDGSSDRLRFNSLCNNLLELTPLVLFVIVF